MTVTLRHPVAEVLQFLQFLQFLQLADRQTVISEFAKQNSNWLAAERFLFKFSPQFASSKAVSDNF